MKRILVYSPDNDPTSWYRSARPWQLLGRELNKATGLYGAMIENYQIDYVSSGSRQIIPADWDQAGFYDLVFLQRPFHPSLLQATSNFKRMGCKIWVDEDDLQTNVPWDMDSAYLYNTDEVQKTIRGCLQMADVVTVSTDYLGEEMKKLIKGKVVTIPNAFDLESFPKPDPKPKEKIILWRGAMPSHRANIMSVRKELYEVMKANPDWKLVFIGAQPWWYLVFKDEFPEVLPNIGYVRHTGSLFDYYATIADINPAIWIVPLIDNPFNRSRSNNAWVDASWIGAHTIAPESPEWLRPGVWDYEFGNPQEFKSILGTLMFEYFGEHTSPIKNDESWPYIQENLLLPNVNQKRLEIVKKLIG
jgi:hypothetical protein